jgi:hydrogenase-4 component F
MELLYILVITALALGASMIPAGRKFPPAVTFLGALAVFVLSVITAVKTINGGEVVAIKDWLSCDSFGALILLLVAFVGLAAAVFSWGYMAKFVHPNDDRKMRRYYVLYNLFLFSMLAVPILSQVALVWIAVELTTLLSVFLVSF